MRVHPLVLLAVAAVAALILTVALHLASGGEEEAALLTLSDQTPFIVPDSAQPVKGPLELGHIEHAFGPNPDVSQARTLEGMACVDDLLMVRTDRETVYARMPCGPFLTREQVASLEGQPAAIRLDASDGQRLFIESTAGSAEFSVSGVWVEGR